jgi:hypothetical protein
MSSRWNTPLSAALGALLIVGASAQVPVNNLIEGMAANNKQLRQTPQTGRRL